MIFWQVRVALLYEVWGLSSKYLISLVPPATSRVKLLALHSHWERVRCVTHRRFFFFFFFFFKVPRYFREFQTLKHQGMVAAGTTQARSFPHFAKKIDRKRIVTFSRMRSNHYNLAASLFRKNMNSSPACACGFESEDLNHFFWACPRFESFRPQLTRALRRRRIFPPYNIESLIANPSIRIISAIMSFIK